MKISIDAQKRLELQAENHGEQFLLGQISRSCAGVYVHNTTPQEHAAITIDAIELIRAAAKLNRP